MAERGVPHFHNTGGAERIVIGAREFMCIGALPPFDHPHIFLDMGSEAEVVCPYCSTVFRHDRMLAVTASLPPDCHYRG